MEYAPTIGLEIHAELKTKTKMFCDSLNDPSEKHPNVNICPICLAHPGILPVINIEAITKLIKVGLALNCQIAPVSKFDRKNYFYPDLPKGYQISQYDLPLCHDGHLNIGERTIRIQRIHMEEDTGRLLHPEGADHTLVDFNRAGVPLMELVTHPDLKTGKEIEQFAKELQLILRYLGASDADMEKGQMRVEVNISIRDKGQATSDKLGTKVEVKNINSINAAARAADYEIKRQSELLESGRKVIQETRGWDENKGQTFGQRLKEGSADYRYFPEPDLPPLRFSKDQIEEIRLGLPELPGQRRNRFKKEYGLNDAQTEIFTITKHFGDYFEKVASELNGWEKIEKKLGQAKPENLAEHYRLAANYIITEFPPLFKMKGLEIDELEGTKIDPEAMGHLIALIHSEKLSSTNAKLVLKQMAETGMDPDEIISQGDLGQISDSSQLDESVDEVIDANPKAVEDYKKGKGEVIKFLVGQVMMSTKGKSNPQIVSEILKERLEK